MTDLTADEKNVFNRIASCEISAYCTMYSPDRIVVSTGDLARMLKWTTYRTRKAIRGLVARGLIERASCGNPAVVSYGECPELIYDAMPPTNGFAITEQGFKCDEWRAIYTDWERSLADWANKGVE